MEQVGYQGYAQSTGFSPQKVSNANVEAIARDGARTIEGMKRYANQDLKNRQAQLEALSNNNRLEAQNRDQIFKFDSESRRENQAAINKNFETEIKSSLVKGQNAATVFKSISELSTTAGELVTEIDNKNRAERETADLWSGVVFGVNSNELMKELEAMSAVEIGGEAIEIKADQAAAMGADPIAVNAIRAANPASQLRSKKAQVIRAGQEWDSWAQTAMQDENIEVTFKTSDGQIKTIKASEAVTSAEKAAIYPELFKRFMVERGLHKMKKSFLAPLFESVYNSYTKEINNTRQAEIKEADAIRLEEARDYLADTKSVDAMHNYYRTLKRQVGYVEGRKQLFEHIYKATDGNGNMLYTDAEIEAFEASAFDDQPTKALGDRFTAEVASYRSERRRAQSSFFGEMEQAKRDEEKQWTNQAEEWVQNQWDGSQESLQNLIDVAIKSGNSSGAQALSAYLSFSNESKQDEYFKELWSEYEALGTLTQEEVRKAPVSAKVKAEWIKKAQTSEQNALSKESQKVIEDYVSSSLQKRLKVQSIDAIKDPSYVLALRSAKMQAMKDVRLAMLQDGANEETAVDYALQRFRKEFDNEKGRYSVNDDANDGSYNPQFSQFALKGKAQIQYPLTQVEKLIKTHPDALDSQVLIADSDLQGILKRQKAGKPVNIPPVAQAISNMYGGNINAIEVVNRQLKRAGLEQIPLDAYRQKMSVVDPVYQRLLSYRPNTTRAMIAGIGSGIGAAPTRRAPGAINGPNEILSTYLAAGGDPKEAVLMTAIAMAESSGKQDAHNRNRNTGDNSYGWWQINMIDSLGPARLQQFGLSHNQQLFDPLTNAKAALEIRKSQGLGAWGAYRNGSYKDYLAQAERAMASYGEGVWRQGMNMRPRVVEYLTGDRSHPRFRADHGGSNYHEHIAYGTRAETLLAARKLESAGIKVTQLKGQSPVGKHSTNSYHYDGLAFDVPADQVPVGQEQDLSRRVRAILGIS